MTKPSKKTVKQAPLSPKAKEIKEAVKERMWKLLHMAATDPNSAGQDVFPGYREMVERHLITLVCDGTIVAPTVLEFECEMANTFGELTNDVYVSMDVTLTAHDLDILREAIDCAELTSQVRDTILRQLKAKK